MLLDAKAAELEAAASSDLVLRQQKLIELARSVLLDPDKRRRYDEQLAKRAAFATDRDAAKPVPLRINGASVMTWQELEMALDTHPGAGLTLLQDGEIEAWVRWSLGEKLLANRVRAIGQRATRSMTPFMEKQELLRIINPQRPLLLYATGKGPNDGDVVAVRNVAEIPRLADDHWERFVQQSDYVIDWAAQYGPPHIADQLAQYSAVDDAAIWLERLVAAIAPSHPTPELDMQGIPGLRIDFGDVSAWSTPTHTFTVRQQGRGYLYGRLRTTAPWLKLSPKAFAGKATQIVVEADRAALQSGSDNQASIVIEPLDGRVAAVQIAVSVQQKTLWKSVTGLFGRKR